MILEHFLVWKEDITSVTREPIPGNLFCMYSIGMLVEFLEIKKLRLKLDVNILKVHRGFQFCTPEALTIQHQNLVIEEFRTSFKKRFKSQTTVISVQMPFKSQTF